MWVFSESLNSRDALHQGSGALVLLVHNMLRFVEIALCLTSSHVYPACSTDHTEGYMMGNTAGMRRLDLKAAALELGITSEAIRRRAKRGTLHSEKGEDGLLYVWLPGVSGGVHDGPHDGPHDGVHAGGAGPDPEQLPTVLLERFEDENDFLRREIERLHRELERKDAIILTLAQRVPELEPRESPIGTDENSSNGDVHPAQERRSWWHRLFFGTW
jgi:hypothetical protein